MTDKNQQTTSTNFIDNFLRLFKDAVRDSRSKDPNDRLMAASVFKFLYKQVEKLKGWEFASQEDRDKMQPIMDDLRKRVQEI